jgi:hypothetical protein
MGKMSRPFNYFPYLEIQHAEKARRNKWGGEKSCKREGCNFWMERESAIVRQTFLSEQLCVREEERLYMRRERKAS